MIQRIQIIKKKVDIEKLDGEYYKRLRYSIKRDLKSNTEILMIEFIPNSPISDKSILKTLLHLQREFTDILIAPKSTISIDESELENLTNRFKASMIMVSS